MKINYEFVTGEKLELEVDDSIGEIVIEMEVLQSRRNRTETRRHNSLESMQEPQQGHNPQQFVDEKVDIEQSIEEADERERLHQAIGRLEYRDALIVRLYYFENRTMEEIGREIGISAMAVSKRLKKIPEKLKSLMS
ncbi:MAG TPA: sigma-70 family RNA polymerase sigma factor [Candidatus Pelethocola excrementipullorum]|nr:sigma-70 family RNA polymerase sigma factor [Candidatus Pelethocola excrementipullorum]